VAGGTRTETAIAVVGVAGIATAPVRVCGLIGGRAGPKAAVTIVSEAGVRVLRARRAAAKAGRAAGNSDEECSEHRECCQRGAVLKRCHEILPSKVGLSATESSGSVRKRHEAPVHRYKRIAHVRPLRSGPSASAAIP